MNLINCIIALILTSFTIATAPPINIVFIIQSQGTPHQIEIGRKLKENIIKQSVELQSNYKIKVHLLDEILNYPGGWTIHNLIPQLVVLRRKNGLHSNPYEYIDTNNQLYIKLIDDSTRWIIFCEGKSRVKLKLLLERLNEENYTMPLYLGHPLYDREPTIIHHFAFFENPKWFPYPMLRAGIVLSMPLFKSIANVCANQKNTDIKQQFSIDAGHELARFIYDNIHIPMTILTTSQQTYKNKNHHINVYYHTSLDTTAKEEKTIRSHTTFNKENTQPPSNVPQRTTILTNRGTFNIDVTSNVCEVSHYDFRTVTTNEIIDKHKSNISKPSGNTSTSTETKTTTSSFIKKQKIILKKASYICPVATWETKSRGSNINKNNKADDDESCAMYAEQTTNAASSMICTPVKREEIYFAVKTCSKYHNERLPIIQTTWAPYAKHVKYFSDIQDDTIPTTNTGILNVEMGHCDKTIQILKLSLEDIENYNHANHKYQQIKWLFLTDDDTILSVSGVCEVLGCYNSMDEIYLGERYGYRLYAEDGFNYITGGGGIAFSLPVLKLILQHCSCPSPTSPDDMILGSCLHSLQLKALHSSRFHQARPNDYPLELLKQEPPISFHKFWQLDPVDVYKRWFFTQDQHLLAKENPFNKNLNGAACDFKTHKMFSKTLNKIPVPMMTSMHHSKEHHVDL